MFIRADLNVPLKDGADQPTTRGFVRRFLAIRLALDQRARADGRRRTSGVPKEGEFEKSESLAPVAKHLSSSSGRTVPLIRDWLDGVEVEPGNIVLLENCRFNKGEKKNDEALAKKMAALCDVYVNDAFGTAHRAEATTHGIARFAKVACAGPLMAAELDALARALEKPGASARRDRRRLQGLHQTHDPGVARRQSGSADRRRRHREHVHARGGRPHRQVAGASRARRRGARRSARS